MCVRHDNFTLHNTVSIFLVNWVDGQQSNYTELRVKYERRCAGHIKASASGRGIDVTKCCPIPHAAFWAFTASLPQTFMPSVQVTSVKASSGSVLWAKSAWWDWSSSLWCRPLCCVIQLMHWAHRQLLCWGKKYWRGAVKETKKESVKSSESQYLQPC